MSTNTLAAPATISNTTTRKSWALWAGRGLTAVPTFMLAMSSLMKLTSNPQMVEMLSRKFGYPASAAGPIGVLELASTILYAIPRTAILGACGSAATVRPRITGHAGHSFSGGGRSHCLRPRQFQAD